MLLHAQIALRVLIQEPQEPFPVRRVQLALIQLLVPRHALIVLQVHMQGQQEL